MTKNQKEQLWANYYTVAPPRQRQCVEQSKVVKQYGINPKTVAKWKQRAWLQLAGDHGAQIARVAELRLYETIDPLRMTTLSLVAWLAIGDNAITHKLWL